MGVEHGQEDAAIAGSSATENEREKRELRPRIARHPPQIAADQAPGVLCSAADT
jgi:hypothetical protein